MTDDEFFKNIEALVDHASVRRQEALTAADVDSFKAWDSLFGRFQTIELRRETAVHLATRKFTAVRQISEKTEMTDGEFFQSIKTLREYAKSRWQESLTAAEVKKFKEWDYVCDELHRAIRETGQLLKKLTEDDS
jgi:hypothetical protein